MTHGVKCTAPRKNFYLSDPVAKTKITMSPGTSFKICRFVIYFVHHLGG
jgi:hypothetical protein